MFPISVIEAVSVECCLQPRWGIDEKTHIIDEMCVVELCKENFGDRLISRRGEFDVQ
jgi:hypothetical protein